MDDMVTYTEQAELVDALRYCATAADGSAYRPCSDRCPYHDKRMGYDCMWTMMRNAADMTERLFARIEELGREIAEKDKEIIDLKREIMTYPGEETLGGTA